MRVRFALIALLAVACESKDVAPIPAAPASQDEAVDGEAPGSPARPGPGRTPAAAPERGSGKGEPTGRDGARPGRRTPVVAPAPIAAPPGAPAGPRPVAPPPDGITQVNSREWSISEDLLAEWKGSPGLLGNVRKVEGGWELFGVRQRAGYHLGMRNGDVITQVNGHQLETRMQQLGAWFDLRNDETFQVVFLRGGSQYSYTYRVD